MPSATKYIKQTFEESKSGEDPELSEAHKQRIRKWRKQPTIKKLEKPTNPIRAKELGYKAKKGFKVVRVKETRGSGLHRRARKGRRPKRMGLRKLKRSKSLQRQAEEKASKKFPNLSVLNSYEVAADGNTKFYEVVLIDLDHQNIKQDDELNLSNEKSEKTRSQRGKTSAGKKGREKVNK